MSAFMIEAEEFQDSIDGKAVVCYLYETDGYFVPYRDRSDEIRVRVFTRAGMTDHSVQVFFDEYPTSTRRHTEDGVTECAPPRHSSKVYFISDGEAVKIGISKNPNRRLSQLQTGHPRRLTLVATLPGGLDEEMQLHGRFRAHHLSGEWFSDCPEIRDFIACNDNCIAARNAA